MAQIYENAYFTIAAASSPSASVSFLNTPREHPCSIALHQGPKDREPKLLSPTLRARRSDGYCSCDSHGPLTTRAWACQEAILSKRIVQYTSTEAKWQCIEGCVCESSSDNLPGKLSIRSESTFNPYNTWHSIVADYSSRNLTLASDKLPAISGVAYKIWQLVSSDYLAGLWKNNLAADLEWWCVHVPLSYGLSSYSSSLGREIVTPSWSWASICGKTVYRSIEPDNYTSYLVILGASCRLNSPTRFGEVDGGSLTLRASCCPALLRVEDPLERRTYQLVRPGNTSRFDPDLFFSPDCILSIRRHTVGALAGQGTLHRQVWDRNCSADDYVTLKDPRIPESAESFEGMVWCIFMSRAHHPRLYNPIRIPEYQVDSFMVVAESLSTPGAFERLGRLTVLKNHRAFLKSGESMVMHIV
ncbi:hypothetical protein LARI1_G004601 [Lachnellula arida]|uniref:Heterokaryon incompatibility domain-containing protein n=1 Tax=Lachnellula arida TaxID=1316785 RepID=A0A8T9BE50_9HELO|nr:hypothetical protein LARI1_G004601 [Lachnellula arida]